MNGEIQQIQQAIGIFKLIRDNATKLSGKQSLILKNTILCFQLYLQTDIIINEYNKTIEQFDVLLRKFGFNLVQIKLIKPVYDKMYEENIVYSVDPKLLRITLASDKILLALQQYVIPLSQEIVKQLSSLREEVDNLRGSINEILYNNLIMNFEEFEANHFLASTLISGRIISHELDKIPGNVNEKIQNLKSKSVINKDDDVTEGFIIKANKRSRDLESHDISFMPNPSDAIGIIGDIIKIVKIVNKFENL
jgi:regulator of replication initiation timing